MKRWKDIIFKSRNSRSESGVAVRSVARTTRSCACRDRSAVPTKLSFMKPNESQRGNWLGWESQPTWIHSLYSYFIAI